MDTLTRWKCQVGIHHWSEWRDTSVDLFPVGDRQALNTVNNFSAEGVNVETLALDTQHRECERCGHTQVRQFVKW